MKASSLKLFCCATALLCAGVASLRADQQITSQFNIPIHVSLNVDELNCQNSPGPTITLSGQITANGGFGIQVTFANNVKGTHEAVVTLQTNLVFVHPGQNIITIPKQPSRGGVGGNPLIFIQFYNSKGVNLTDEIFLGRCVQGLKVEQDFLESVISSLLVTVADCENHPGPFVTVGGSLSFSEGINARIIFQNNAKGTHKTERSISTVLIFPANFQITIPKQPVLGGAGGNPLIYIQLLKGNGDPIGDRDLLGRCNKL